MEEIEYVRADGKPVTAEDIASIDFLENAGYDVADSEFGGRTLEELLPQLKVKYHWRN